MTAIRHSLELMLNPFFLLFLLLLCSLLLVRKNKRAGRGLLALCLGIVLLFSTGFIPRQLTSCLESSYPVVNKPNPNIKWVVVLGGGHFAIEGLSANNLLSGASIKRLVEGVRLFEQLPKGRLLLSGGGETKHYSEAVLLQQLSRWFAVPAEKITLEDRALNTEEQAKALVSFLHKEPFYLVTSAIHMPRSMFLCQQQGLNPIAAPTDYTLYWNDRNQTKMLIPNAVNFYYFNIAMHELLGRSWALLRNKLGS